MTEEKQQPDSKTSGNSPPVALVTGAAARIGAAIVKRLHAEGYNVLLHFNHSQEAALALAMALNTQRNQSVHCMQADLLDTEQITKLAEHSLDHWGRLDVLVNNASSFYPTPFGKVDKKHWEELMGINVSLPFFLSQLLADALIATRGCIINIVDVHARSGIRDYAVYSMAKAALYNQTRVLAKELAPDVRVNGVAPGAILWPEQSATELGEAQKQAILEQTTLKRLGDPEDIAAAVWFLIQGGGYITGQVIKVDGGRSLSLG